MNKDNVFKSSPFHLDKNDILHLLFLDESGSTVTVNLGGIDNERVPDQPVASAATSITSTGFTANWNLMENSTGYYLDVAKDSAFTSMVLTNYDAGNTIIKAVTGLKGLVTYYYRVRAYNNLGTSISSSTITLTTLIETVLDGDSNVYPYVTIGTQQWLISNLKTTKYIDGVVIPNITDNGLWAADTTGAYCWYNNDLATYKADYGALYNHYAISNAHGIAPMGWRVATNTDFTTLQTYLGITLAGGKMKEVGTSHWQTPNTGATNETGFTAVGSGIRFGVGGTFSQILQYGTWWASTLNGLTHANIFWSAYTDVSLFSYAEILANGYAIRCVRDI
jgi:uncharacterized protein (TIGR02145 family)